MNQPRVSQNKRCQSWLLHPMAQQLIGNEVVTSITIPGSPRRTVSGRSCPLHKVTTITLWNQNESALVPVACAMDHTEFLTVTKYVLMAIDHSRMETCKARVNLSMQISSSNVYHTLDLPNGALTSTSLPKKTKAIVMRQRYNNGAPGDEDTNIYVKAGFLHNGR